MVKLCTRVSRTKYRQNSQRKRNYFHSLFWVAALTLSSNVGVEAVQSPDGTVAFESAVLLLDSHTTFSGVRVRQAIYYFDIELPDDVGEPLQKVAIKQRTGGDEVRFRLDKTKAYIGDHNNKQKQLNVTASEDEDSGEITVEFEQPVIPGNKITVGLKPKSNPDFAGVYLFGVTAFPAGEKARGLYLGAGRLHFYRSNDFYF